MEEMKLPALPTKTFMDYLDSQGVCLTPADWLCTLKNLDIPEDRIVPGMRIGGGSLTVYMKFLLLAKSLQINMRPHEWTVMYYRSGFLDGTAYSRAETGALFGVSPGRIRYVEEKAFRGIREQLVRIRKSYGEFLA